MSRPGNCQRAQVGNQDCPWMLHGERRFYSKRLQWRVVASEATEQVMSFLAS